MPPAKESSDQFSLCPSPILVANKKFYLFDYACLPRSVQEVPEGRKESAGGPWQFIALLPLFDPPRHDSAETIRRALNLGVNVKMITGIIWFLSLDYPIQYVEMFSAN